MEHKGYIVELSPKIINYSILGVKITVKITEKSSYLHNGALYIFFSKFVKFDVL